MYSSLENKVHHRTKITSFLHVLPIFSVWTWWFNCQEWVTAWLQLQAHKTFCLYYKGFYWVAALNHLLHRQFCVYASTLEASCFTNAHTLHTCPAFFQTCLEEFFSSFQILGLLALLPYIVSDSCKPFLQTHLFVGIYSVLLLFCIPALPFASTSLVRTGLCVWLSPEAAIYVCFCLCLIPTVVKSQNHVRSSVWKGCMFLIVACNVIHDGENSQDAREDTVYLLRNCRLAQVSAHECFSRWLDSNTGKHIPFRNADQKWGLILHQVSWMLAFS